MISKYKQSDWFSRCALYKKLLDLLDEESVSGERRVELVYKFDEKFYRECLKM